MKRIKLPRSIVAQVVLALLLGVGCGVFFGEFTAGLQTLGDAYVRLLEMTALPYVVAALISGIGRLNPAWAAAASDCAPRGSWGSCGSLACSPSS